MAKAKRGNFINNITAMYNNPFFWLVLNLFVFIVNTFQWISSF